jgi:hypothetical protein
MCSSPTTLSSPLTTEYTLGVARTFGARSYAKAVFVQRKTSNFIEEFILLANGKTPIVINGATGGPARQHLICE